MQVDKCPSFGRDGYAHGHMHTETHRYTDTHSGVKVMGCSLRTRPHIPATYPGRGYLPCDYQALGLRMPHGTLAETLACITVGQQGQ